MKWDRNRKRRFRDTRGKKGKESKKSGRGGKNDNKRNLQVEKTKKVLCAVCGYPVVNVKTALRNKNGELVHFDCALREVRKSEKLKEGEEVYYVGGGAFAVVSDIVHSKSGLVSSFKVKKKIQYELREENK